MRTAAFIYAFALGWYIRASGLDEDLARLARDGYDATVLHTAAVLRRAEVIGPGPKEEVAA